MIWQNYHASDTVLKAAEPVRLWETERGIVEIDKDTLAIPVMLGDRPEGYVFHGHSRLVLDMIVETEEGAVGKPVEKEIGRPFLMIGNTESIQHRLSPAAHEDLSHLGYTKQQEFATKAEDLLNRFSGREAGTHLCSHSGNGLIFVFQNEADRLDILLAKGAKIVYKAMGTVFLSNGDRTVIKGPDGFVCVSAGKSVIIKR